MLRDGCAVETGSTEGPWLVRAPGAPHARQKSVRDTAKTDAYVCRLTRLSLHGDVPPRCGGRPQLYPKALGATSDGRVGQAEEEGKHGRVYRAEGHKLRRDHGL